MSSRAIDDPVTHCRLTLTMVNKRGLHARAAARFVRELEGYGSEVTVTKDGHAVDGRSIMGLLMLGAPCGGTISVDVRGQDAEAAAAALSRLVENGFGEVD
ncbi:HPr family phosphocarrier protein [Acuticoccus mangrovi]|uniref:HPr family phosphocarrier protein n=1 Tax=Acuticoccus mangrovi TaxID=2796142 RepID=A0A934IPK1_9HYPH|nr:HPr family phosphocarrier protein [Acuticoccus mangrovi]MBJ3777707.1 HPr family phosphocarrier protein [Acuticoccus mangrovi]